MSEQTAIDSTACCNCGSGTIATTYPSGLSYCAACEIEGAAFFGGCPVCHRQGGLVDVGHDEWMVCRTHKVRWLWASTGPGAVSSDRRVELIDPGVTEEMEAAWRPVAEFRDVEPWFPERAS